MKICIATSSEKIDEKKMVEFVKWVCEQAIFKQSVVKAGRGERLITFDVRIIVKLDAQTDGNA